MRQNLRSKSWPTTVLLSLLAAIAIEIAIVLLRTLSIFTGREETTGFAPFTFHTLWEAAALAGLTLIAKRWTSAGNFFGVAFFGAIASAVLWMLLPGPDALMHGRYVGVSTRFAMDREEVDRNGQEGYVFPLHKSFLYHRNDPNLLREMKDSAAYAEHVATRSFLFWQTGFAFGYDPSLLSEYNGGKGVLNRVELFTTVGPLVVVESAIRGVAMHFPPTVLLVLGYYAIKREHVWFS